ncbi:MAG: murein biosynthesis integral membrane protein MurJ [Marmoricola sp.]
MSRSPRGRAERTTTGTPGASGSVLGSTAVMASGTVVSRLTGFVRNALLVAALGNGLHADVFNIANTIPNMLYILLAGGVFNAVLVPQLVRAQRRDADGGDAYTSRMITLTALFLGVASAVLVVTAPWVMHIFLDGSYFQPACSGPRESVFTFARYCLPQVFFYGMFVLVGQVLNARGSFGPMMWAPIANNVVAIGVLGGYLATYGTRTGSYSGGEQLLLGLGSTAGIALQLLVLVPFLRSAGFHYRPRFDFRHTGLGHTLRLGIWTVLFVVVNQIAYTIVVRVASSGTAQAAGGCGGAGHGAGYTVYSFSFLLVMVPHSVITVSLATAVLPRLSGRAAEGDLRGVGTGIASTLRTSLAVVLPLMALLPVIAPDAANLVYGYGAGAQTSAAFVPTMSLFALALVFFTTHYLMLRGFYALEQTRRVFLIQCAVAATNIVLALVLARGASSSQVAPRLVVAYTAAYVVGAMLSALQLSGAVGGLDGGRTLRFLVRMVITVGVATGLAWLTGQGIGSVLSGTDKAEVLARLVVTGLVDVVVVLVLARLLRIREVTEVTTLLRRRLAG